MPCGFYSTVFLVGLRFSVSHLMSTHARRIGATYQKIEQDGTEADFPKLMSSRRPSRPVVSSRATNGVEGSQVLDPPLGHGGLGQDVDYDPILGSSVSLGPSHHPGVGIFVAMGILAATWVAAKMA